MKTSHVERLFCALEALVIFMVILRYCDSGGYKMPRKSTIKTTEVWERKPGSNIW